MRPYFTLDATLPNHNGPGSVSQSATASFTESEAWALAQLLKRQSWSDIRQCAVNDDEAHQARNAVAKLQHIMAEAGIGPCQPPSSKAEAPQTPKYAAYLLHQDGSESDRSDTDSPLIALVAYKHLIARADFRHHQPCAVLEADGREIVSILVNGQANTNNLQLPAQEFTPPSRKSVAQLYAALLQHPLPDHLTVPREAWMHARAQLAATDTELHAAIQRAGWTLSRNRLSSWRRSDAGGRIAKEMTWSDLAALLEAIRLGGIARK